MRHLVTARLIELTATKESVSELANNVAYSFQQAARKVIKGGSTEVEAIIKRASQDRQYQADLKRLQVRMIQHASYVRNKTG